MNDKPYIEHFYELRLTEDDLKLVGHKRIAFLAMILYAANEINAFFTVLMQFMQPEHSDKTIIMLGFIDQITVQGTLTTKTYEFMQCFDGQRTNWKRSRELEAISATETLSKDLGDLKSSKFFRRTEQMKPRATMT